MIKNIIFDLGNIIINYNQDRMIKHFTENKEEVIFIKEKIFNSPEWKMMDLGQITNSGAIKEIQKRNDIKYNKLISDFLNECYKTLPINEDIVEIAKKLKERNYSIYVLSNMGKETYEYFKNIEFFELCDGIVISSHENVKKPDEKIFKILLNRFNLNPEECLFIDDDDTNRSYDTANALGILGRRVEPNSKRDVIKLLNEFNVV